MIDLLRRTPLGLILLGGLLVFANTFDNSFHYDDGHSIVDNPHLRSLANIPGFFVDPGAFSVMPEARMYRPLLLLTLALNWALGGSSVWGYHLVNLALHLANAWLVWLLGSRLAGRGAWLAALLFLLHPVVSEPVNYISSRSALLATFFYLLAMWWLCRAAAGEGGRAAQVWTALCFAGALASKEIAFTFPLAGALYLYLLAPRPDWRLLRWPAALAVGYLLGTRAIVGKAVGAPVRDLGLQWATQVKAGVFYLWTLVMPVHLSVEPQFLVARGWVDAPVVLAGMVGLSAALVLLRAGGRVGLFGVGWAVLALAPAALVPLNVLVNENRLYLPLAGLVLALAGLHPFLPARRRWLLALVPLVPLCLARNAAWQDELTLWADAVAKGPAMPRAHVNLGKAYLEAGRYQESIAASRRALAVDPNLDRAHYNIGRAYQALDEQEEAVASYRRAVEIQPDLIEARNNLGNALLLLGHTEEALAEYRQALAVYPHAQVWHNLGKAHLNLANLDSAAAAFGQAIRMDPENPEPYRGLIKAYRNQPEQAMGVVETALARWPEERDFWRLKGEVLASQGKEAEARQAFSQAGEGEAELGLRQGDAARKQGRWAEALGYYEQSLRAGRESGRIHNARGDCLLELGQLPEALAAYRLAAQLEPKLAVAYAGIGKANLRAGRPLEAVAALEKAVDLEPRQASFWSLLGLAQATAGKFEAAAGAYRQVVQLQPGNAQAWRDQGTALLRLGRAAEGLASYERYLALDPPEDRYSQQVRQQVEELRRQLKH